MDHGWCLLRSSNLATEFSVVMLVLVPVSRRTAMCWIAALKLHEPHTVGGVAQRTVQYSTVRDEKKQEEGKSQGFQRLPSKSRERSHF